MSSDWSLSNNLLNIDQQLPKNLLNLDPSAPKESIEALIANFDDIPRLMQKHKAYDPIGKNLHIYEIVHDQCI